MRSTARLPDRPAHRVDRGSNELAAVERVEAVPSVESRGDGSSRARRAREVVPVANGRRRGPAYRPRAVRSAMWSGPRRRVRSGLSARLAATRSANSSGLNGSVRAAQDGLEGVVPFLDAPGDDGQKELFTAPVGEGCLTLLDSRLLANGVEGDLGVGKAR